MAILVVGSKMKANNGYGQNGDATSPSARTVTEADSLSGLKATPAKDDVLEALKRPSVFSPQTRTIDAGPITPSFVMVLNPNVAKGEGRMIGDGKTPVAKFDPESKWAAPGDKAVTRELDPSTKQWESKLPGSKSK